MPETLPKTAFLPRYALETVPRYTSYPPATRFTDTIGGGAWESWVRDVPDAPVLSLYVHIPFCRSMCWYCGCNTTVPNRDSRIERYLGALHREIATRPAPAGGVVRHIHFGGGSPDMLSPERFGGIMTALRRQYDVAPDAEIAVELDPRGVDPALCAALAENGVTRASLGVQDLSEEVQTLIHRIQPAEQVDTAARRCAPPASTRSTWTSCTACRRRRSNGWRPRPARSRGWGPTGFPCSAMPMSPGSRSTSAPSPKTACPAPGPVSTRWRPPQASSRVPATGPSASTISPGRRTSWPGPRTTARCAGISKAIPTTPTTSSSASARPRSAKRPQGYVQNIADPARYAEAVEAGRSAVARGLARSWREQRLAARLMRLLCVFDMPLDGDLFDPDTLTDVIADGLARLEDGHLKVTEAGRPYVRNIAARIDPDFAPAETRHSRAV